MGQVQMSKSQVELFSESPMVIKNPKGHFHIHSYGGLTPFFAGLSEGKLMATRCPNADCPEPRLMWLPPRLHCPDCMAEMEWVEAPTTGRVYTHSTVLYPGMGFRLSTPCPLISVEIDGVCTKLMSYLKEGDPVIGMPVKAEFNTKDPTYTILDLAWVPA